MTQVCIGIRSSHSAESSIRKAIALLGQLFSAIEVSPVYRAPLSAEEDETATALSMAMGGDTDKTPDQVVAFLREVESALDSPTATEAGEIPIELSLLLYGNRGLTIGDVEVPSPRIEDLVGLLVPLTDLVSDQCHPLSDRPFLAMRDELLARDTRQAGQLDEVPFAF